MALIQRLTNRPTDKLALTWAAGIAYLSLSPLGTLPEIQVSDKLEHFAAYALLGMLGTLSRKSPLAIVWTLLLILVYGGLIEIVQPYVNRYMELADFVANAAGAVCGGLMAFGLRAYYK